MSETGEKFFKNSIVNVLREKREYHSQEMKAE